LAASTDEAQLTVAVDIAKQMVDYLANGTIVNAVNVPSIDGETRKTIEPLLYLAERMGRFMASYAQGRPSSIDIEYRGECGISDMYPITAAILMGYLAPMVETVNAVSAVSILEDHGIECNERRRGAISDYTFEISVAVTTDEESHSISGTLFSRSDPRICMIDATRVDARPEGHMLVLMNEDKPLIIGRVGMIIGEAGINIANMVLGRDKEGGRASTVLNLHAPLSEEVLETSRRVPHVLQARLVSF
jgi:D-3-phosphoglycerate dehydrogenase